ncbi:MAG: TRAP transporter large permease subunit, partial [Candidatus Oxydemutatoraceae bacterium WSBS_2016_MAG_OTU14]
MLALLLISIFILILTGFPVAFVIGGISILFLGFGVFSDVIHLSFLHIINAKLYGIMTNQILLAIPLFVLMGVALQRSYLAEELLKYIS